MSGAQRVECYLLWARQHNKPEFPDSPHVALGFSSTGFFHRGRGEEFGTSKGRTAIYMKMGKKCLVNKHLPGFAKTMGHREKFDQTGLAKFSPV